ncbi:MAG: PadR family transcriptional regulator [Promethearchaeota archaeon]
MESKNEKKKTADALVEKWIQGFHRGSLRFFILHLLSHEKQHSKSTMPDESPFRKKIHGYHIAKAIKELTDERWEPKTASIYPILNEFKEEGIIKEIDKKGKRDIKKYQLTDYGVEVAQKLEQARRDFAKAFRIHRHGPPPRPHLQMIKSKLELTDEEFSELLQNASLEDLEMEETQLKETILMIQNTLQAVEEEIKLRRSS